MKYRRTPTRLAFGFDRERVLDLIRAQPELDGGDITITSDKNNSYGTLLYDEFTPYTE